MYLGATLEKPRHVCFALFVLLCPTPSLSLLAPLSSSSYPHRCLVTFDSMRNIASMSRCLVKVIDTIISEHNTLSWITVCRRSSIILL